MKIIYFSFIILCLISLWQFLVFYSDKDSSSKYEVFRWYYLIFYSLYIGLRNTVIIVLVLIVIPILFLFIDSYEKVKYNEVELTDITNIIDTKDIYFKKKDDKIYIKPSDRFVDGELISLNVQQVEFNEKYSTVIPSIYKYRYVPTNKFIYWLLNDINFDTPYYIIDIPQK